VKEGTTDAITDCMAGLRNNTAYQMKIGKNFDDAYKHAVHEAITHNACMDVHNNNDVDWGQVYIDPYKTIYSDAITSCT
jgi:hypothetical protein